MAKQKTEITVRQRLTFQALLKAIEKGENFKFGDLMIQGGYSKTSALNPGMALTSRPGWQELMAMISDEVILGKIYEVLLDKDKDSSLKAADMLLKIKDKYPAGKLKIGAFQERDKVLE